jgi:hypothetical protein
MRTARVRVSTLFLLFALLLPVCASAETLNFKEIQAKVAEYKAWLDQVGTNGSKYWVRLDSSKRPHRLFIGEGFLQANFGDKERFIEIFSRYLAGHPDKNMLIDIFDGSTEKAIGEYGFGGFKLF